MTSTQSRFVHRHRLSVGRLLSALVLMWLASSAAHAALYPHESPTRATRDISGVWQFRLDRDGKGEAAGWSAGFTDSRPIPVPSSWNELFDDARNYFGNGWYQTEFYVDPAWQGRRIGLRFGSANYRAKAWLNGELLGEHVGGHLPFVFDVTAAIAHSRPNRLVVLVENELREDRVPAAAKPSSSFMSFGGYPAVTYDFFPYSGLHRPVLLFATPMQRIDDVTVRTGLDASSGVVDVEFEVSEGWNGAAEVRIEGAARPVSAETTVRDGKARASLRIPDVRAWGPDDPYLYRLSLRIGGATTLDEYRMKIGVRTVEVRGDHLLLNGKPIFLTGFGKHEDFPIHGRGLNIPVIVRDFELLKWIGANSFRTSHYPYSDEAMMLADEYGLLVIDETPAVSLGFTEGADVIEARRAQLSRAIAELIERDKNHPSVIMWSLANEPGLSLGLDPNAPDRQVAIDRGTAFFEPLFAQARAADPTRPVTLVSVGRGPDEWIALADIVCANVYFGWYYAGLGQLQDVAAAALDTELRRLHDRHRKPVVLTEFGADTIAGVHAQPSEMWSEEYQAEMMEVYMRVAARHPWVSGMHPWAFADFRTSQGILRAAGLNHKGVFTRERRPKMAAHRLRELWHAQVD